PGTPPTPGRPPQQPAITLPGGPLRARNFRQRSFVPAFAKAGPGQLKLTPHKLRHIVSAWFSCGDWLQRGWWPGSLGFAPSRVVFLLSALMILSFFSSRGLESWDAEHRPLIPEGMPVLVDDDLRFDDGPAAPRPAAVVNRWLRELPASGAPAPSSWENYARV